MKKHRESKDPEMLMTYLTNAGCMKFIVKYAEQSERDPKKLVENVDTLLDMTSHFETLDDFYTHVALFSGEIQSDRQKNGVKVLTIHSSKGLEFKYVFLPFWIDGNVPLNSFSSEEIKEETLEEERRVAFVGLTRAKKFVQISSYMKKHTYGNQIPRKTFQSQFVKETIRKMSFK